MRRRAGVEPPPQLVSASGIAARGLDIAGNSAAETDIPNRLTGNV